MNEKQDVIEAIERGVDRARRIRELSEAELAQVTGGLRDQNGTIDRDTLDPG